MSDPMHDDEVLFDHIGQIVMSAILQGVIIGNRDGTSDAVRASVDDVTNKATLEVVKHIKIRLQGIREEIMRSKSVNVF